MANGFIQTADQAKKYVQNWRSATGSRTFGSLYTANELAGAKAEQQVEQQYGEQIGQAYKSAMAQRGNILSSNLGEGYKGALLSDTESALNQAYDTYMSNLAQSKQQIASNVSEANTAIDKELTSATENVLAYDQAHQAYAESRWQWAKENLTEDEYRDFAMSPDWQNYTTYDFSEDESAKSMYEQYQMLYERGLINEAEFAEIKGRLFTDYLRLKTDEELSTPSYVEEVDPETGEVYKHYTSIVDEEGNITEAGTNYYDFLENYAATRQNVGQSWEQYLAETNPELLDWAKTYNPYNATEDPYYAGTFRTMYGTASNDYKYTFIERFGGLSKKEVDTTFGELTKLANVNVDDISVDNIKGYVQQYRKIAEQVGIDTNVVDWDAAEKEIDNYLQQIKELDEEITSQKVAAGVGGSTGYAISSTALVIGIVEILGGLVGVATGGGAPAGGALIAKGVATLAGSALGYAGTSVGVAENVKQIKALEGNKAEQEKALKQYYLNNLTAMINKVQADKREQQIREYKSQKYR